MSDFYAQDLSFIHHQGFSAFASEAGAGLRKLLVDAGIRRGVIVDLGCGSGIWAKQLTDEGYEAVGVDSSPAMIEIARSVAPRARLYLRPIHRFGFPLCAAVTALGEVLSYSVDTAEDVLLADILARIAAALVPGGLLIFDLMMRATNQPMRYDSEHHGPNWQVRVEAIEDPARSQLTRRITTTVMEPESGERQQVETHLLRTYDSVQVEGWLKAAGFTVETVNHYGTLKLGPQRLGFVARKRAR